MGADVEARLRRLETRIRRVVDLLVDAPINCTTIPSDSGGDFQGNDWFIGTRLREEAESMLSEWDAEDDQDEAPRPTGGGATEWEGNHG